MNLNYSILNTTFIDTTFIDTTVIDGEEGIEPPTGLIPESPAVFRNLTNVCSGINWESNPIFHGSSVRYFQPNQKLGITFIPKNSYFNNYSH